MVVVTKKKGESNDTIFRKFTRLFIDANYVEEIREKMFHKKPSQIKKEKRKERQKGRHRSRR